MSFAIPAGIGIGRDPLCMNVCQIRGGAATQSNTVCLQVEWNNPQEPAKGFQYLYLVDSDYNLITQASPDLLIKASPLTVQGKEILPASRPSLEQS